MKKILSFLIVISAFIYSNAATYTVTNTNDAGAGSLRQAITSANSNPMDADNIVFNIPNTDPNFNSTTGVYTITLASLLPYVTSISVSIDGTTQPGNTNINGPEVCLKSTSNLLFGLCFPLSGGTVKGMIINGFQLGVLITKYLTYPSGTCLVSDCYLGVNYNGSSASPNDIGVACYGGVTGNTIINNIISGNTTAGIGLRTSNSNIVQGNKIGTDRTGMYRIPNYYGIAIDSAAFNTVGGSLVSQRNLISGNNYAGVAINTNISHSNIIKGNYIGVNLTAATSADTICNYYGIAINESYNNVIGGSATGERNIISSNTDAGIAILGLASTGNSIKGNFIGTNASGTDSIANGNGILLSGASNTIIGGSTVGEKNVISGNHLSGITMAYFGTRNNVVKGNYIGTDKTGMTALSNHTGVYIFSNANSNIVGGSLAGEKNIISANYEMGICMEAADSNVVKGNFIGPDSTGLATFKFSNDTLVQGNGLYFNSNAAHNIAGGNNPGEGNIISGNRVYGLIYYGNSPNNSCIGNYIGVDKTGNNKLPNATGICVDGGASHNPIINNVLSGNIAYGIFIVTTGTYYNELRGNKIGTNAAGTDSVPNQIGVILGGGTKYNIIGGTTIADRNIISGNRFNGIEVADSSTMYNNIIGNYIGTNAAGNAAIPNHNGIGFATLPSKNNIENNLVSGNKFIGILLYERSDSNTVYNNKVGTAADGISPLGNGAAGIVIDINSRHNKIGEPGRGNIVAFNDTAGIVLNNINTKFNTLSANIVYGNPLMGIDIFPFGVNTNDAGDTDNGCNGLMNYPVIGSAINDNGTTTISGTIDYSINGGPSGVKIELFKSDNANMFAHGDATEYLGFTTANAAGNWTFTTNTLTISDNVTATSTDLLGNSSEFAQNTSIILNIDNNLISDNDLNICVFPNPASSLIQIKLSNTEKREISLTLYNISGKKVKEIITKESEAIIDISNLKSGLYGISVIGKNINYMKTFVKMSEPWFIGPRSLAHLDL